MRITAAWIRDDDEDPSKEYEYQIVMLEPPNGNELLLKDGKFTFGKALYRFVLDITAIRYPGPGILTAINRIRPLAEDASWLSQEYPVLIQEQIADSESPDPSP
jgi:hypothetical protein